MATHDYNSWTGGDGGGSGNPNGGGFHGGNTGPNIGQYNISAINLDYGGNSSPSNTADAPPSGNDYQDWNYEDVLTGVLGLATPKRSLVTQAEWIGIANNSSGGSGLYRIFAATWRSGVAGSWVDHKDIFVYVNPDLLTPGGPWDNYFNTPAQAISNGLSGNYGGLDVDPRTLVTAADEVQGVQDFFNRTTDTLNTLASALKSDQSAFKGQAGEAFYDLVHNLWSASNSAYSQMTSPAPGYAGQITNAGNAIGTFMTSLWNAMVAWTNNLDYTPIGAIYQALLDGNVITQSANDTIFTMVNPGSSDSSFGDLTSQQAWTAIEAKAKTLWTNTIASSLDPNVRAALQTLVTAYLNAATAMPALTAPTLQPIHPGNAQGGNPNLNLNIPNINIPAPNISFNIPSLNYNSNVGGGNFNPNIGNPNVGGGNFNPNIGNPNVSGGNFTPNIGNPNIGNPNIGNPNIGNPNIGGSSYFTSGIGNPSNSNIPGLNGGPGSLNTSFGSGPGAGLPGPAQNALQQAAGDNGATQNALQSALGMIPPGSPLNNAVQTALGDAGNTSNALNDALASGNPAAIQQALADNAATQDALRSALAQAPSAGPLHDALQTALGDSQQTGSQLQNALQSAQASPGTSTAVPNMTLGGPQGSTLGGVPGAEQSALQNALSDNGATQGALQTALGLTPSAGPLHNAVQTALGDAGNVTKAVNSALGSGSPSAVQHAISQNAGLENALRSALSQAPSTGPLHNALQTALGDAQRTGQQLQQSLNSSGVAMEPSSGMLSGPQTSGTSLGAFHLPAGQQGLTASFGSGAGAGAGGIGGVGGLAGGAAAPVSSGAFVAPAGQASVLSTGAAGALPGQVSALSTGAAGAPAAGAGTSSSGTSAVPFYPPMAGMGGMGGLGQQQQERERSTWLAEDEDVWGTEPDIGPSVLGRDLMPDDETDSYDDYAERAARKPRQDPSRLGGR